MQFSAPTSTTDHPLSSKYQEQDDNRLIDAALIGDKQALNQLLKKHQPYIYNIAWKMTLEPENALEITQEVMIKVATRLASFHRKSAFRTWLYRIAFNHFLNMKRRKMELQLHSFEVMSQGLERIPDLPMTQEEEVIYAEEIEEVRIRCSSGMLLCLNREQRLIYILGDVFEVDQYLAAEILDLSPGNFRIKLHRARKELQAFMTEKCGLLNPDNPCRCAKKTKAMMQAGFVDPKNRVFNPEYSDKVKAWAVKSSGDLKEHIDAKQAEIFQTHRFQNQLTKRNIVDMILEDPELSEQFMWKE